MESPLIGREASSMGWEEYWKYLDAEVDKTKWCVLSKGEEK